MPKISIQDMMRRGDIQGWTSDVGDRLSSAVESLRDNSDDVLERLSNGLPQPRNLSRHKNEQMTYGAWALENSRQKRRK